MKTLFLGWGVALGWGTVAFHQIKGPLIRLTDMISWLQLFVSKDRDLERFQHPQEENFAPWPNCQLLTEIIVCFA